MNRMPYILISTTGLLLAVLLFTGCNSLKNQNADKEVVGISLSQSHMEYTECFSFFLRKENDKVLLDAQVNFYDEPSIVLESVEVETECFEQLKAYDKEHGISKSVIESKTKSTFLKPTDDTVVTTTVYFDDGTDKSAKSGVFDEGLYDFFLEITMEYKERSVVSMQAE